MIAALSYLSNLTVGFNIQKIMNFVEKVDLFRGILFTKCLTCSEEVIGEHSSKFHVNIFRKHALVDFFIKWLTFAVFILCFCNYYSIAGILMEM